MYESWIFFRYQFLAEGAYLSKCIEYALHRYFQKELKAIAMWDINTYKL